MINNHIKFKLLIELIKEHSSVFILFLVLINSTSMYSQEGNEQKSSQLESALNWTAKDSIVLDMENKQTYLFKEAHIDYGEVILDACFIKFDFETKNVFATYCLDSNNQKIGVPIISDGGTLTNADSLIYNFKTKKGITYKVVLKQGEGFIHGEKVKKQNNGDIHIKNAMYTTCELEHPHFYFKLNKAVIKPDDKIVSGLINLHIADVPTPLGLPFAFFPNKKNKGSNGLIIPNYGTSEALGFYLLGGGYYHQFRKGRISTSFTGDVYSKSSWGLSNLTSYKVRYKYSGQFSLNYRNTIQGEKGFEGFNKRKDFFVKWNHNKDQKHKPGTTFRALVNAGTTTNFRNDYNNISAQNYLTNTFNSNIAWSKRFKGEISSNLSANLRHSQNSNTDLMTFTLPEISYNVNRFYPFKMLRKNSINKNFIHEIINQTNINYQMNTKNELRLSSKNIFQNDLNSLKSKSKNGMRHNINASSSIKLFGKNVTINPSYRLSSLWYLDQINKVWDNSNKEILNDSVKDFSQIYSQNFSVSATTKIYGFYSFAKFLKGKNESKIRHTITPNINFNYKPNSNPWVSYQSDTLGNTQLYSPFSSNIYGTISPSESGRIGFSLINSLELKKRNLKDTSNKEEFLKFKILDNLSINSGYDLIKDSFHLDNFSVIGRTTLWKKINIRFAGRLDPYKYLNGKRIDQYQFSANNRLGTLTSANLALGANLKSSKRDKKPYKSDKGSKEELDMINSNSDMYIDFNIPWTIGIDYKIDYRRVINPSLDTSYITQSIGLRGDLSITKNWKLSYMTNYDFINKEFSFTSINIARDLHCWQMSFNWIPLGFMRSYNLNISVKSSILQDLKLQRRRTWYDNNIF